MLWALGNRLIGETEDVSAKSYESNVIYQHIDGLVQERRNSSVLAMV